MTDMADVMPISALLGGGLIGAAAAMLILFNGRVAGVSGIVGGLMTSRAGERRERVAFIVGLIAGPPLFSYLMDGLPSVTAGNSPLILAVSGLLVGFGTRLGGGCTSGHGICGVARLSPRSLAATAVFVLTAMIATYLARHVLGAV